MQNKKHKNNPTLTKELYKLRNRISRLNEFIVDLEFDNRQLRMEINFLYSKLSQKSPSILDREIDF